MPVGLRLRGRSDSRSRQRFVYILLILIIFIIVIGIFVLGKFVVKREDLNKASLLLRNKAATSIEKNIKEIVSSDSNAVKIGKKFSNGACEGSGKRLMTTSPMKPEDIQMVLPYGTMVGGHVIPTSHGYVEPLDRNLGRDRYEVRAMADATLYSISRRAQNVESGEAKPEEFQLWFAISCTHFYYYDLVTSLSPDLRKVFDQEKRRDNNAYINVQVKAGQVIGKIGGQTLDYGVWDTELHTAPGVLVPKHYEWDGFRLYLADPLNYYTDELKKIMLSKYIRTAQPLSGKVDYDIDGKLIGGWFLEGTGELTGGSTPNYWTNHLAIAPDYLDPTVYLISVGDFAGEPKQFSISRNAPDPKNVGVDTGLIKYDLLPWNYIKPDGTPWDRIHFTKGVKIINDGYQSFGCVLVQMLEARKLKFEGFGGKSCADINGFTIAAKIYER